MINTPAVCAAQNPGKMVLLDADGITGAEGEAVISRKELMTDPDVLRAFIDYGVANYPAEKYDLILWDHGGGTTGGFGSDEHAGFINDMPMSVEDIIETARKTPVDHSRPRVHH